MNLNFYKTATLFAAVSRMPVATTFLRDKFFPGRDTFPTEDVYIDFRKGKRKMAPFVAPRVGGITVDREGFRTEKYTAPRIAPQRILTIDDIVKRGIGENVFSSRTPEQRQAELLAQDLVDLENMITRREEWLASQILFYGKTVMKGHIDYDDKNFIEQEIDYGFTNKETLAGTDRWGEPSSDIYGNLEEWRLEVIQKTDVAPNIAIFGREALAKFRNDEKIQKMMNLLNMNFGTFAPVVQANGLTFIGRLPELGLDIYTYDAWYVDDNGESKPYVPADHVLLAKENMGGFVYGAVTQMEEGTFKTYEGNRVPKSWADNENEQRMIRLSSRPVPKPSDIDDWFVAKVV